MALAIFLVMLVLLLLGFPMMIPLIIGAFIGVISLFGDIDHTEFMVQQMLGGIRPASLIAVPMFILAADIMTRGHSADRLIDLVMSLRAPRQGRPRDQHLGRLRAVRRGLRFDPGHRGRGRRSAAPAHAQGRLQGLFRARADRQFQRHRLPDSAEYRHDHLRRGLQVLDPGTVHRRHRPGTADSGAVLDLQHDLRHGQESADRGTGRPGASAST